MFPLLMSIEEMLRILQSDDDKITGNLFEIANLIRAENVGDQVCIHGIIEFSNYCSRNCHYCGIRADNKKVERYRMSPEEIKKTAINAIKNLGYKMIVLQSGEDYWYDDDKLFWLIKEIRKEAKRFLLFLSIGSRGYDSYKKLYKAGARGVLYRFETSDAELYKKLHPDSILEDRIEHIKFMKDIGYLVASGSIIGLPNQTIESLLNDIYLLRDLKVTMATMGPFIACENTPLENEKSGTLDLALKMIALTRIIYPKVRIPITTALEKIGGNEARTKALMGGGNAFMLNLTPAKYRDYYEIYPGKNKMRSHIHSKKTVNDLNDKIIKICNRHICKGWGTDFTLDKQGFITLCNMSD
jgi:biotin synthase